MSLQNHGEARPIFTTDEITLWGLADGNVVGSRIPKSLPKPPNELSLQPIELPERPCCPFKVDAHKRVHAVRKEGSVLLFGPNCSPSCHGLLVDTSPSDPSCVSIN